MQQDFSRLLTTAPDHYVTLVENVRTGVRQEARVERTTTTDLGQATKKAGWEFKWRDEARKVRHEVYKLVVLAELATVQGLVSLENRGDHTHMSLIESAPHNKGRDKQYNGVAGGLVAVACKLAFEHGHEGNVAFTSKTALIEHYERTLGTFHYGNYLMILETGAAVRLIRRYFKPI